MVCIHAELHTRSQSGFKLSDMCVAFLQPPQNPCSLEVTATHKVPGGGSLGHIKESPQSFTLAASAGRVPCSPSATQEVASL